MPLFPQVPPNWARAALALALVAVTTLALLPGAEVPVTTSWDKLDHWFAFFTLTALAEHGFPRQPFWRRTFWWLLAYGVGIEIAQSFTPDRQADLVDIVADAASIASYGLLRQLRCALRRPAAAE